MEISIVIGEAVPNFTIADTAGTGNVDVYASHGAAVNLVIDEFGYFVAPPVAVPTVTAISPTSGVLAGGNTVTITGTNLTGATAVDFGTVAGTDVTDVSATSVTAVAPAEAAGTVDVTVTTPSGTSATSTADQYTYVAPTVITSPTLISVAASPASLAANGTMTSVVTATVTDTSGPVVSDSVAVTAAGVCGTITPATAETGVTGVATYTYTASTTAGDCTITATDTAPLPSEVATGTAIITQTAVTTPSTFFHTTVVASPPSIVSGRTSTITATVTGASNGPVSGDEVELALSGSECGTLTYPTTAAATAATPGPIFPDTASDGQVIATYTAPSGMSASSSCTVTATEADQATTNTATIAELPVGYAVAVSFSPAAVGATGTAPSVVTATVTFNGAAAPGLRAVFSDVGSPADACETLSGAATTGIPTNAAGQASFTYESTDTSGFCTITAAVSNSAATEVGSGSNAIVQTGVTQTASSITVTAAPGSITADGTATSSVTATVDGADGSGITADEVELTIPEGCGSFAGGLTTVFAPTTSSGATDPVLYSTTGVGPCTISATESDADLTGTTTVTGLPKDYSVSVTANPATLTANGTTTSVITATVDNTTGAPQPGDLVTFKVAGTTASGDGSTPGSLPATFAAVTNAAGQVNLTYTSSDDPGFYTVTASEADTGAIGSVTLDQTNVD
jgi:hypothetical protein